MKHEDITIALDVIADAIDALPALWLGPEAAVDAAYAAMARLREGLGLAAPSENSDSWEYQLVCPRCGKADWLREEFSERVVYVRHEGGRILNVTPKDEADIDSHERIECDECGWTTQDGRQSLKQVPLRPPPLMPEPGHEVRGIGGGTSSTFTAASGCHVTDDGKVVLRLVAELDRDRWIDLPDGEERTALEMELTVPLATYRWWGVTFQ